MPPSDQRELAGTGLLPGWVEGPRLKVCLALLAGAYLWWKGIYVKDSAKGDNRMTVPARRERPMFADLMDWFESEFPALPIMRPFTGGQLVRVEDYVSEGQYVVRAELPGIDPEKDVEITVDDGVLTVKAERREEKKEGGRSEFRYGSFSRSVSLPAGADEDNVSATYRDGILEVRTPLKEQEKPEAKHIAIAKQ
jgi:HSP20 family protein